MISEGASMMRLTNVLFEAQEHNLVAMKEQNPALLIPPKLQEIEQGPVFPLQGNGWKP